ncbi:hypothetical protein [Amnibacterium kyonggiense]|uniref:Uncharacterized protein n=1 Tax=Amnibacterium kyonggiense TaxID=595671 RepID=A0A4R7FKM8_9MICO|nr:hypothetical protein [Amnibacterium kyonggiense]TDS76920.1 hypothetical protein CLV52_1859 [Amnibacterium kyonggiense]
MICAFCGGTALAVVLLPGHDRPEATVCLGCGRAQPIEQDHAVDR